MRRKTHVFARLRDQSIHQRWMIELLASIDQTETSVVSACIGKVALSRRYAHPFDPYNLAIRFCLERTRQFLALNHQAHRRTQVIFESREQTSRSCRTDRIPTDSHTGHPLRHHHPDFSRFPIEPLFISKQSNLAGHQLCDLLARPLAKWSFDRNSHQRPIQIIQTKLIAHKVFRQTGWQRPTRSRPSPYFNGYTRVNPSAKDSHAPR